MNQSLTLILLCAIMSIIEQQTVHPMGGKITHGNPRSEVRRQTSDRGRQRQGHDTLTAGGMYTMTTVEVRWTPSVGQYSVADCRQSSAHTVHFNSAVYRYVIRAPVFVHTLACMSNLSCTVRNVDVLEDGHEDFARSVGEFGSGLDSSTPGHVWYAKPGTAIGLYKYQYNMCSYADPGLCAS